MSPRRVLSTAMAVLLLLSLACALPGVTLPFGRSTPTPTPLPPLPPTLAETDPVEGEEFNPAGPLTLYFDQPMERTSVEAALSVDPFFDSSLTWVDDTTLQLSPVSPLPRDTVYRVTLAASARSAAGLVLAEAVVLNLRTAAPLRVVQVVPDPDTVEVDPGVPLTIVFNRPVVALQAEGAQPAPLSLDPAVDGTGEWLDTGIYVFRPAGPLPGGTRFTARVDGGLQDLTGAALDDAYTWSFETAMPRVTSAEPVYDGRPTPLDVPVRIAFNQAMDRTSVERAFALTGAGGVNQRGTFTWNDASTEVAFKPSSLLEYDADYEVRLAANASAPSGSSLGSSFLLPFRTAGRPAVVASTPTDGGQKDEWEGVQLTFAGPMLPASL
ncbi:MAG: Ig-like domain-containing protein, partial [Anaerolineales bacterium]|nr:Ig-like domain-containing protein [Anaerolineales bacterium]